jgi:hypothetical protein
LVAPETCNGNVINSLLNSSKDEDCLNHDASDDLKTAAVNIDPSLGAMRPSQPGSGDQS